MKKSHALIFAVLFFCLQVHAAIGSSAVWEVITTGTAGDVNGCFFDTAKAGTNYARQDAAQYSGSNLASTVGSTNPCVVTSATHNFVTADEGNAIHITAGTNWTTGFYEIVSTSGNAATLDRACGSAASISSGSFNVGGACPLGNALDTTIASTFQPGNIMWIKNGSYTITGAMTFTDCTNALPCSINGYLSTRGDNPTGTNRPTLSSGTTSNNAGAFNTIQNLIFTGTAATMWTGDGKNVWYNNKFTNTSTTTGRIPLSVTQDLVVNNEFISYDGFGFSVNGEINLVGNYFHDSATCIRVTSTGSQAIIQNNLLAGCYTNGISVSGANTSLTLINANTIYGAENQIGTGLLIASGASNVRLMNNIVYGWSTGISASASTTNWSNWNDFNNNGTNRTNWTAGANDISTAPAFQNVAQVAGTAGVISGSTLTDSGKSFANVVDGQDFMYLTSATGATAGAYSITSHTSTVLTLDRAPGGSGSNAVYSVRTGENFAVGPNMKFKGFPGVFPASLTTGYMDVGGVQRHEYGRPVKH